MVNIVCIGDSIVEGEGDEKGFNGWVGRLAQHQLKNSKVGKNRVYNLGVGMETSMDLLHRLYSEVLYRKPEVIILQAAHGDSRAMTNNAGIREFEIGKGARMRTYKRMFDFLSKLNIKVLILGLNPIGDNKDFEKEIPQRKDHVELTRKSLQKLCNDYGLEYFDPKNDIFNKVELKEYLVDGIHPNSKGYDLMFEKIYDKLKELGFI